MIAEGLVSVLDIRPGMRIVSDNAPQFVRKVLDVFDCDGSGKCVGRCISPRRHLTTDSGDVRFCKELAMYGEYDGLWSRII
jgi:hypothetical protein